MSVEMNLGGIFLVTSVLSDIPITLKPIFKRKIKVMSQHNRETTDQEHNYRHVNIQGLCEDSDESCVKAFTVRAKKISRLATLPCLEFIIS